MKKIFSLLTAVLFAGSMMAVEVTDVLTYQTTGVTGNSYTEWSNKKATSNAVYAGQSAASNNTIQLRSKNSNSGVVSTASAGKLVSVTVKFNSNTAAGRVVDIYASNNAYTAATDLYAAATAGTKVAHFNVHADSVKTYTFADEYAYIGIRSSQDALYLDSIIVVWETGGEPSVEPGDEPVAEASVVYDWAGEIGTTIFGGNTNITTGTVNIHENTDEVNGIKFGSSYVYAEGKYIAIKPAEGAFKAGDTLKVSVVFNNSDLTKYCMASVYAADGDALLYRTDSATTLNGRNAGEPAVQKYILASDQDSLLIGRYGNTGMFVTFLQVVRPAAGEEPVVGPQNLGAKTIAEFLALKNTTDTCILTGVVSNIVNATYGNFDLTDESGKVYVYGLLTPAGESKKFADLNVAENDTLTILAVYNEYNGNPQAKNAVFVEVKKSAAPVVEPVNLGAKTIAEFLELKNTKDTCLLTGVVSNIVNTTYGNFDLTDETGKVYVYGLLTPAGESKKFAELGVAEGDELTVKAIYNEYNGTPQAKNAIFVSVEKAQGIENIELTEKAQKVIVDGVIYIVRDGKMFNLQGTQVR